MWYFLFKVLQSVRTSFRLDIAYCLCWTPETIAERESMIIIDGFVYAVKFLSW